MSERPTIRADVTPRPPQEGAEWKPKQSDIPPELEPYIPEAKKFIDNYRDLFCAIAGDRSLRFTPGAGFYIKLEEGEIVLDVDDWRRMKEEGVTEWQIVWSVCHEISHFKDLQEAPKELLDIFTYLESRAKELEPQVLEILKKKLGGQLPEYMTKDIPVGRGGRTMTFAQHFLYQQLHMLYNSLDDMYVNGTLALRSAVFHEQHGSQAPEIRRFYRDHLFPTDSKKPGVPPRELEAADYAGLPKSFQLAYALLRRRMVGDQEILVDPAVQAQLKGYADPIAERMGITMEQEVTALTRPLPRPTTKTKERGPWSPGWRYERIKAAIEPAFVKFLMEDIEKMPPPPPPQKGKGDGKKGKKGQGTPIPQEGEEKKEGEAKNPWEHLDQKPEPIDLDTIQDFLKQQDKKKKEDKKEQKEEGRKARLTPEEKAQEAQRKEDCALCEKEKIDPAAAEQYRELEKSIEPYKEELAAVFEALMQTISERVSKFWLDGFRSGKFNVESFIRKHGPDIAAERPEFIPWGELSVYEQQEWTTRLVLFPDKIRVRLVLDGSGSMNEERLLALKQLSILFLEALSTFEAIINLRFRMKEPIVVDTEIWMFGNPKKSKCVKTFAQEKNTPEEERADRFRAFSKINASYGGTCDAEPFWKIVGDIDDAHAKDLEDGKAKEFIFEVTDGGSNMPSAKMPVAAELPEGATSEMLHEMMEKLAIAAAQDTRNAIAAVEKKGAVARGFQIGEPSEEEKETFEGIWGEAGQRVEHVQELAQKVAKLLASEIAKIQFQIQYYGGEEEGEEGK